MIPITHPRSPQGTAAADSPPVEHAPTQGASFPHIPAGADQLTRRFLILQHRARAATAELFALEAAHAGLLSLLTDIDPETAALYAKKSRKVRRYLPELGGLLSDLDEHSTRALESRRLRHGTHA